MLHSLLFQGAMNFFFSVCTSLTRQYTLVKRKKLYLLYHNNDYNRSSYTLFLVKKEKKNYIYLRRCCLQLLRVKRRNNLARILLNVLQSATTVVPSESLQLFTFLGPIRFLPLCVPAPS